jgi:hypothetical protein
MRIKMLMNVTDGSGSYEQGQVVEIPKTAALSLVARGRAIVVGESAAGHVSTATESAGAELESAALSGPEETAVQPKPRRKKAKAK